MTVHVVGNICLDTSFRLARFPAAGETLNADACDVGLGGKGANQALAAWRTGTETRFWAPVGCDGEAETIRRLLAETGLRSGDLVSVEGPSDRSSVLLDAAGENLIVSAVAAARGFHAEHAGWVGEARAGDILVMQNNLGPATTAACLARAREKGLFTVLNASPLGDTAPPPILRDVDLVVVNRGEGEQLTGEAHVPAILAALLAQGPDCAVLTLGAQGAVMANGDHRLALSSPPVAVVDTSGAGDVLCGTLAGLLDREFLEETAFRLAVLAAGRAVMRPGAFGCGPTRAEMDDIVKETR
ncbi:PfkB family carbohydrate kinase [Aureimonas psammosilenae]|uniref:PfkB family carbohydrate kinase n=1 Tax=Aureimonas psammosilenae TaxID=2495496 RepID=UPI001869C183|nr:PfkB family carbohydrate kinase [Aureimonas psammosilenae]